MCTTLQRHCMSLQHNFCSLFLQNHLNGLHRHIKCFTRPNNTNKYFLESVEHVDHYKIIAWAFCPTSMCRYCRTLKGSTLASQNEMKCLNTFCKLKCGSCHHAYSDNQRTINGVHLCKSHMHLMSMFVHLCFALCLWCYVCMLVDCDCDSCNLCDCEDCNSSL